jgi:hypothetical protein
MNTEGSSVQAQSPSQELVSDSELSEKTESSREGVTSCGADDAQDEDGEVNPDLLDLWEFVLSEVKDWEQLSHLYHVAKMEDAEIKKLLHNYKTLEGTSYWDFFLKTVEAFWKTVKPVEKSGRV